MAKEKERKQHAFYVDVAEQIGIVPALLLGFFHYWVHNNSMYRKDETYKEGKYWTYCSVAYIQERYPYLTVKQVNGGINKLISEELIETGNFNKKPYDRTKWYTLTVKGMELMGDEIEDEGYLIADGYTEENDTKRTRQRVF